MSAKQHSERGITMEMNKNKVTMSDMLASYVSNRQAEGFFNMVEAMYTYGLIDVYMWKEWNHLVDLLGRIRAMEGDEIHSFETRMELFVQVLDEAKEFDAMDKVYRHGHLMECGIDPFGSV